MYPRRVSDYPDECDDTTDGAYVVSKVTIDHLLLDSVYLTQKSEKEIMSRLPSLLVALKSSIMFPQSHWTSLRSYCWDLCSLVDDLISVYS